MFGHQNDQQNQQQDTNQIPDQLVNSPINNDVSVPQPGQDFVQFQPPSTTSDPLPAAMNPTPPTVVYDQPTPGVDVGVPSAPPVADPVPNSVDTSDPSNQVNTNDLLDIKQQALNQLSPLVGHLEQSPEEKFRTTMMMIQASDNQNLLKDAYASAQEITDEKLRAQALLDVINEINYFTQHHDS